MYATLGSIAFDLPTYFDGLHQARNAEFAEHKVIEGKPKLQFVGDQLGEIDIEIVLHAFYCTPQAELQKLRDALAAHLAMDFSFGNGEYLGKYVLTNVTEDAKDTDSEGRLVSLHVHLTLKEYNGDDAQTQPQGQAVAASGTLPGAVNDVGQLEAEEGLYDDDVQACENLCFDLNILPIDWPSALEAMTKIGELSGWSPSQVVANLGALAGPAAAVGITGLSGMISLGSAAALSVDFTGDQVAGVANLGGFLTSLPGSNLVGGGTVQALAQGGDVIAGAGTLLRQVTANNATLVANWLPSQGAAFGVTLAIGLPVYNDLVARISAFADREADVPVALFAQPQSFGWVQTMCRFPATS
jgi:phage protein U